MASQTTKQGPEEVSSNDQRSTSPVQLQQTVPEPMVRYTVENQSGQKMQFVRIKTALKAKPPPLPPKPAVKKQSNNRNSAGRKTPLRTLLPSSVFAKRSKNRAHQPLLPRNRICPHREMLNNPNHVPMTTHAKYQLQLVGMQAKLTYILTGILGEKSLAVCGYPKKPVHEILYSILKMAKSEVLSDFSFCGPSCLGAVKTLNKHTMSHYLIKMRITVLKENIEKLLKICVPCQDKWTEFGWDSKSVEEIMEDLVQEDIPIFHSTSTLDWTKLFS